MDRLALLTEILTQNPTDAFARYGLAMEYANQGDIAKSMEEFGRLRTPHPDYAAGYFMAAQPLIKKERRDEAKTMLTTEIAPPTRTKNRHAQSEMQAMLDE